MKLSKLRKIHIIIIGSVLCVGAAAAIFFLMIKPLNEEYAKTYASFQQLDEAGSEMNRQNAERDLSKAMSDLSISQQKMDVYMKRFMPNLNFTDRANGMINLWNEQIYDLGPRIEHFAKDKSVKVLGGSFSVPAPPVNPNDPLFAQEWLKYDLGTYTVMGDFKSVMNNIRRWNTCSRLIVVSPPTLAGSSPNLVASYTLTCYVAPAALGGATIPMAGGGAAAGSTPGGAPGGSPGMPGAPGAAGNPPGTM